MQRVDVQPEMLRWARERAAASLDDLKERFPGLEAWERGEAKPTLKQLERYAKATFAPFGYFFFQSPPEEPVPIADLRTIRNERLNRPSANLLDTIYQCQHRQDWFRDYATTTGQDPLRYVASASIRGSVQATAESMRTALGFDIDARSRCPSWTEALRMFIEQADSAGVLVMCSGVVANNTSRALDPEEFRGFALVDPLAPLVFINGADTKAAQMFTLAHELAHVWLGKTALSDASAETTPNQTIERWCNEVAAELLVPMKVLRAELRSGASLREEMRRLAKHFKVSTLVILRRLHDARRLSADEYRAAYKQELDLILSRPRGSGGNFYLTQTARVSRRFARALVESTLEGNTLYRDAFRLLGVRKAQTFEAYGRSLGYAI